MRQQAAQPLKQGSDFRIMSMAAVTAVAAAIAALLLFSYVNLLNEAVERGVRLRYAQQSGDAAAPSSRNPADGAGLALENSLTQFASASRQRSASFARADR
ncbi:hypothetical protein BH11PSE9_BH11PSE9_29700 [soil metagenome]